jgi:hypothetical protein
MVRAKQRTQHWRQHAWLRAVGIHPPVEADVGPAVIHRGQRQMPRPDKSPLTSISNSFGGS